uniref:Uncharacterized protein n=1 Tax=Rhodnius prolixus TaxID=13249 RepID=T1IAT5_RHOPR
MPKRIKVKLWFHGFTKDYYFLLTIKIKRDQIFFDLISDLRELLEEDVAVFYKGDMVKPSDTPTDLELKKGDIIDVYPISSLEGLERNDLYFYHNGILLYPFYTPQSAGLQNGDTIYARLSLRTFLRVENNRKTAHYAHVSQKSGPHAYCLDPGKNPDEILAKIGQKNGLKQYSCRCDVRGSVRTAASLPNTNRI